MKFIIKNISDLTPHPLNDYLFDPITGDKWNEFVDSIRENGVINPVVVNQDGTIISGHMRVAACKALGIESITCVVEELDEDAAILALIESNIRQRGVVNSPSVKLGRIINELERIYNLESHYSGKFGISRDEMRKEMGVTHKTAQRGKALASLTEDAQAMVESGSIPVSAAYDMLAKLTPEQQVELCQQLDSVKRYTQKEIKTAIEKLIPEQAKVDELQTKLAEYQQNDGELELRTKLNEMTQRERETYEQLQAAKRQMKRDQAEYEKRLENMESLLEENGDRSVELERLMEERDEYAHDARVAMNDADLTLVCKLVSAVNQGLSEVACDPNPLSGDLAAQATTLLNHMDDVVAKIRARLDAGGEDDVCVAV